MTLVDIQVRECLPCDLRHLNLPRQEELHQLIASTIGAGTARATALRYSFRFDCDHGVWLWSVEGREPPADLDRQPS